MFADGQTRDTLDPKLLGKLVELSLDTLAFSLPGMLLCSWHYHSMVVWGMTGSWVGEVSSTYEPAQFF